MMVFSIFLFFGLGRHTGGIYRIASRIFEILSCGVRRGAEESIFGFIMGIFGNFGFELVSFYGYLMDVAHIYSGIWCPPAQKFGVVFLRYSVALGLGGSKWSFLAPQWIIDRNCQYGI